MRAPLHEDDLAKPYPICQILYDNHSKIRYVSVDASLPGGVFMRPYSKWLWPFHLAVKLMNVLGTLGIFAIMVLIVVDVSLRSIFSQPLIGVPEIVRTGIVSIVFLQAAHTLAVGRFTSSDMFLLAIERRSLFAANILRSVYMLTGAGLFAFVAIGALDQVNYAYEGEDFIGSQGLFTIPTWPMHAVILIGSLMLALQFCVSAMSVWGRVDEMHSLEEEIV